ncbi:MAG TPA: mechanosensitive ion channel family protein [Gemmatimonadaceae bacterium]|nr:mechanosensitive ion channel family protein [Gemmatimonadaceae bacterium]
MFYQTFLDSPYYGNTIRTWLIAAATFLLTAGLLVLVRTLLVKRFTRIAERTRTRADDAVLLIVRRTHLGFLMVTAVLTGSLVLALGVGQRTVIARLMAIAILIQGAIWGTALITFFGRHYSARHAAAGGSTTMIGSLSFLARVLLWSVMLLLALDNIGIDVTALIAGLGVGGIAVALAVQTTLGDVLAAVIIAVDKPFAIGDFIIVDGMLGTVRAVGLKTTRIASLSGEEIIISNSALLNSRIRNYQRMRERRIDFRFGVAYETAPDKLAAIPAMVREIIATQELARVDRVHFLRYADSWLEFEVVYYVLSPEYNIYMDIQQAVNLTIFQRFAAEGIQFAYPTRTVYLAHREHPSTPSLVAPAEGD